MSSLLEVSFLNDDPEICGVFVFQTKALLWTSPENTTRLMKFLELSNCLELSGMETDVKQHMLFTLDNPSNRLYYKLNHSESRVRRDRNLWVNRPWVSPPFPPRISSLQLSSTLF